LFFKRCRVLEEEHFFFVFDKT
jgi:hypothetical protein